MTFDPASFYDRYWAGRDSPRAEARSRERAAIAARLLAGAGLPSGARILDAGCGPGWALEELALAGFQATGTDVSSAAVEGARARGLDARPADLAGPVDKLRRAVGGPFQAVALLEVLEHLVDPLGAVHRVSALLAPGGLLAISLPNEISIASRLLCLAGRLPFGGHDDPHVRHFDRRLARRFLRAGELAILREKPVSVLPPSWRLLRAASAPLLLAAPGLFSLATLYICRPASSRAS